MKKRKENVYNSMRMNAFQKYNSYKITFIKEMKKKIYKMKVQRNVFLSPINENKKIKFI